MKNKKMIIKGAGKFTAKLPGCDELVTLGTLNNMRLDIQLDMQDIEGGDSSVALDTLLRKKTIDITAEDAKFDLNMLRLVLGAKLKEGVNGAPYSAVQEVVTVPASSPFTVTLTQTALNAPIGVARVGSASGPTTTVVHSVANNTFTFPLLTGGETVHLTYYVAAPQTDPDGFVWVLEEKHNISSGTATLLYGGSLHPEGGSNTSHISIRTLKGNKLLKQVANTPLDGQYTVSNAGVITFHSGLEGVDVYVNYKRSEVVDVLEVSTKDFPLTVQVVHDGLFEQKDGLLQGFQTELYACRVKSNFTLDAVRQQASTHSVTLTVIDPERIDGRLGTIKRYEVANPNLENC